MQTDKALYYVASIATHASRVRGTSLCMSEAFREPGDARRYLADKIKTGDASMGCVVIFEGGKKKPLLSTVMPPSARKIVEHWEEIWEATK